MNSDWSIAAGSLRDLLNRLNLPLNVGSMQDAAPVAMWARDWGTLSCCLHLPLSLSYGEWSRSRRLQALRIATQFSSQRRTRPRCAWCARRTIRREYTNRCALNKLDQLAEAFVYHSTMVPPSEWNASIDGREHTHTHTRIVRATVLMNECANYHHESNKKKRERKRESRGRDGSRTVSMKYSLFLAGPRITIARF